MDQAQFIFDSVLSEKDICNYTQLKKTLIENLKNGRKIILYGLRNTGKTSLIKSSVIPSLKRSGYLVIYIDLYGVRTLDQIGERIYFALQKSMLENFPYKTKFEVFINSLKNLRPVIKTDPIDGVSLSIEFNSKIDLKLSNVFKIIQEIHKKNPIILAFDEFQDIHFVKQAEALLRSELQELNHEIGIVFLGSKKNMLSQIFAKSTAPLAGTGIDLEVPFIDYKEYHDYILDRFKFRSLSMSLEDSTFLQNQLLRIPEAINIVCDYILRNFEKSKITQEIILESIHNVTETKRSRFEEWLSHLSPNEQKVLVGLAKQSPVKAPSGYEFVSSVRVSQKGVSNIIKKLKVEAIIYEDTNGIIIPDPLLASYLRRNRL